ncbi:hypothetical protein O181_132744 [Austropuccinia psidii MF-1]|uniref:Uncharacterized protein n=1 Tax=Austropuccinia psidii MF-1 TaxID=1389203 RepID=A0A9Q3QCC5_9BASI|nr:hypothetical protein [Austropuccinia psidii MF-1]
MYARVCGAIGVPQDQNDPLLPNMMGLHGVHGTKKMAYIPIFLPMAWAIERVQEHQEPELPKAEWEVLGAHLNPRGPLILIMRTLRGAIIVLWPHFLDGIFRLVVNYSYALNSSACIIL